MALGEHCGTDTTNGLHNNWKVTKNWPRSTDMYQALQCFETILSYMPECGYIPTAADRFEWFLPSVTEAIYASAKTHCLTEQINGTLE